MRKSFVSLMFVLVAVMTFSSFVMAQNQGTAGAPAAPAARPETKPWNQPEQPRTTPPNAPVARPPLVFKQEWKMPAGAQGPSNPDPCCWVMSQDSVATPNVMLKVYGPSNNWAMVGNSGDEGNPIHSWTGLCPQACALTFADKNNYVDLTKGKIRWNTKVVGFHVVRPVLKLADGTYLIGDLADGATGDWKVSEFYPSEVRWLRMDSDRVTGYGNWITKPDLTKVDEIGYADIVAGSAHNGSAGIDVATMEVYGKPVSRSGTVQSELSK
jgi:hypothetical protein